jgi:hypothetical protein
MSDPPLVEDTVRFMSDSAYHEKAACCGTLGIAMANNVETRLLLTEQEVSERIAVPKNTLSKWRMFSSGPAFIKLPNGRVRYPVADLERWLSHCERGGTR